MPDDVIAKAYVELLPKAVNFGRQVGASVSEQLNRASGQMAAANQKLVQGTTQAAEKSARSVGRSAKQAADENGRQTQRIGGAWKKATGDAEKHAGYASGRISKQFAGMTMSVGRSFSGLGAVMAAGLGVAAAGAFLKSAIASASDLNETVSKTGVIFGQEALPGLVKWAKGAATAFGQTEQQALDAASTFALFGKSAGLSGQAVAGFSTKTVELASDMASFFNTSPQDAVEAIGAAFRGESEPIRRYNVLLDDASLRNEAVRQGLIKTTKTALTPQTRVLAVQALIMRQTSAAQGDFARTSGGLANQQRILSAQFTGVKTSIGAVALPMMVKLFTFLNTTAIPAAKGVGRAFAAIPAEVKVGVGTFLGFSAAAAIAITSVRKIIEVAKAAKEALAGMSAAARATTLSLGAIGVGLAVAAAVYAHFAAKNAEAKQRVNDLKDTLNAATGAITDNTKAFVANQLQVSGALDTAKRFGLNLAEITQAALGNSASMATVNAQIDAAIKLNNDLGRGLGVSGQGFFDNAAALQALKDRLNGSNTELDAAKAKQQQLGEATGQTTTATKTSTAVVDTAAAAYKRQKAAADKVSAALDAQQAAIQRANAELSRQANLLLGLSGAQISYQAAVDATTAAIKANGHTHDLNTEKGRANQTALNDLAKAAIDQRDAMLSNGVASTTVAKVTESTRAHFIKMAIQMGYSAAAARKMAGDLIKIPNVTRTARLLAEKKDFEAKIAAAKRELDNPKGVTKARTAKLKADIRNAQAGITTINTELNALPPTKTIKVTYTLAGAGGFSQQELLSHGLAAGGKVLGPGTTTNDRAGLWALSTKEWVIQAVSSMMYGDRRMKAVNEGTATVLAPGESLPGRATGGPGRPVNLRMRSEGIFASVAAEVEALKRLLGGPGLAFARSQVGKPYIWGAAGPRGYDCSGFMSAITNVLRGVNPYHRLGSTGTMPWPGFVRGLGNFSIGWFTGNPGHMAGTLNGVNVESRGGRGVVVGPGARGATNGLFDSIAHLKGFKHGGRPGLGGDLPYDDLPEWLKRLQRFDGGGPWPSGTVGYNGSGRTETVVPGGGVMTVQLCDEDRRRLDRLASRPIMLNGYQIDRGMSSEALNRGGYR